MVERRQALERARARAEAPKRLTAEIHITQGPDGELTCTSSNVTRRNAYQMLQGCYIMAGEMFDVLGPVGGPY